MSDLSETIFPFGMYKGKPFKDIPITYLDWAMSIAEPRLKDKIQNYLKTQAEYDQMDSQPKDWKEGREDAEDWRTM